LREERKKKKGEREGPLKVKKKPDGESIP